PQLLHPQLVVELDDRTHVRVVERGVRLAQHVDVEIGDDRGNVDVVGGQLAGKLGKGDGDVEPAVASQPLEERAGEVELRRSTAGGDESHEITRRRETTRSTTSRSRRSRNVACTSASRA